MNTIVKAANPQKGFTSIERCDTVRKNDRLELLKIFGVLHWFKISNINNLTKPLFVVLVQVQGSVFDILFTKLFISYINFLSICPTLKSESMDKSTLATSSCARLKTATTVASTPAPTAKKNPTTSSNATTATSKYPVYNIGKTNDRAEPAAAKGQDSQRPTLRFSEWQVRVWRWTCRS